VQSWLQYVVVQSVDQLVELRAHSVESVPEEIATDSILLN
jgi:hypothetical protein